MGIIKVMDEVLANKIAAGEVVERICNAVKELVENSIDAGSKNIKIELTNAGIKKIRVIDDGCGMSKEDAILCFDRHATSKIKSETDLYFINTLGFRGEALASIAAVSKVTLETSKKDDGTKVVIEGGKIISKESGVSHKGTIIEVKDIFYNTPVRLKFLRSENAELASTTAVLERIALSHPEISISLYNNETEVLKTTGSNDMLKTIYEIYGYNVSKNMVHIKGSNYDYEIDGYITNINIQKSTRSGMITLVNNRVVQNSTLNRIIKDAYHTFLAETKYPIVVINIETDPTLIDVNIHPTKQDIKFSKMDTLEELLFSLIRDKLNETDNVLKGYVDAPKIPVSSYDEYEANPIFENKKDDITVEEKKKIYEEVALDLTVEEPKAEYYAKKAEENLIKPVGLALGTYLFAQSEDMVYMMDIHAANERINYEYMLNKLKTMDNNKISLLFPINIELTKDEYLTLKEYDNVIKEIGIIYEDFGVNTIRVLSHPTWLREGLEEESIRKIFDLIYEMKDKFDRIKFNDRVAMTLACKMSVKANTSISYEEQEVLIKRLFECESPFTCPHGRPTIIKYPKHELEKMFKRVN